MLGWAGVKSWDAVHLGRCTTAVLVVLTLVTRAAKTSNITLRTLLLEYIHLPHTIPRYVHDCTYFTFTTTRLDSAVSSHERTGSNPSGYLQQRAPVPYALTVNGERVTVTQTHARAE